MERAGVLEWSRRRESASGTCGHARALECDGRAEDSNFVEVHNTPLNAKAGPACESEKGIVHQGEKGEYST